MTDDPAWALFVQRERRVSKSASSGPQMNQAIVINLQEEDLLVTTSTNEVTFDIERVRNCIGIVRIAHKETSIEIRIVDGCIVICISCWHITSQVEKLSYRHAAALSVIISKVENDR